MMRNNADLLERHVSMRVLIGIFVGLAIAGSFTFVTAPARADEKPIVNKPIIQKDPKPPKKDSAMTARPGFGS